MNDMKLNWWEIRGTEPIILTKECADYFYDLLCTKYGSLYKANKILKLSNEATIYEFSKYRRQGVAIKNVKHILVGSGININSINKSIESIGYRNKWKHPVFPIKIDWFWSKLFGHVCFDGYCENNQLRYAQYSECNRKNFIDMCNNYFRNNVKVTGKVKSKLDINLPSCVATILCSMFNFSNAYSDKITIDRSVVCNSKRNAFAFLSAAFIDEGSVLDSPWIVRGLKNDPLIEDLCFVCNYLNIKHRVKNDNRPNNTYKSIVVAKESIIDFYNGITDFLDYRLDKVVKFREKIINSSIAHKRDSLGRYIKKGVYNDADLF